MNTLLNTDYDSEFQDRIFHFVNFPELLPFVGKNWDTSKRILLIGESHYLKYNELHNITGIDYFDNWYKCNSANFEENFKKNIRTRTNVILVEQGNKEKPLSIYRNLRNTLLELDLPGINNANGVFDKFSYYNYFQKPAYDFGVNKPNRSIEATVEDKTFAFETLLNIVEIIKPATIIFVSKKSFNAFNQLASINKPLLLNETKVDFVPHAGRQWWNKVSKNYQNRTGKNKFKDLVRECYSE
ncbi:MAG: hypothetical protein LPJ89_00760 [Hymenobacteraceae bacterium]|nr:hypothetical protein [Hymenobacteraceae bacterium]